MVLRDSREIDLEEADPQERGPRRLTSQSSSEPILTCRPGFKGVSDQDSARLSEFVNQNFSAVCHIVTALCGPEIDVEGTVAEAIARAVEQLAAARSIETLPAWVTRVAVNLG